MQRMTVCMMFFPKQKARLSFAKAHAPLRKIIRSACENANFRILPRSIEDAPRLEPIYVYISVVYILWRRIQFKRTPRECSGDDQSRKTTRMTFRKLFGVKSHDSVQLN